MYRGINVICPTMGRANNKLPAFVSSCLAKAVNPDALYFTFMLHEGDVASAEYLKSAIPADRLCMLYENEPECDLSLYFNRCYNETMFSEESLAVSLFGDDMVFITKGWDAMMLQKLNDTCGLGIVYGDDDNVQHGDNCVYFITSRRLVEYTGMPFMCEMFKVEWIDTVWYEVGKELGVLEYLPMLHIAHRHAHNSEVGPDKTFIRMRKQVAEAASHEDQIAPYVKTVTDNVRKHFDKIARRSDIVVAIPSYDRLYLLRKTIDSIMQSVVVPSDIHIYDDGSVRTKQVQKVAESGGFVFHGEKHLGCEKHHRRMFDDVFKSKDTKWLVVVDSDSLLYKYWFVKVSDMVDTVLGEDVPIGGLFNKGDRNTEDDPIDGYEYKDGCGGIGMVLSSSVYKLIPETDPKKNGWDNQVCKAVISSGKKIITPVRSYIQHMGYVDGIHANDRFEENICKNFCGDMPEEVISSKITVGDKVLVSCMAFKKDVVYAAVIANCLQSVGVKVTWLTIPHNVGLIESITNNIFIKAVEPFSGDPYSDYSEITSYRMEELYPGYDGYVNLQMSSRENAGLYRGSELSKIEWLKKKMSRYTDIQMHGGEQITKDAATSVCGKNQFRNDNREKVLVCGYGDGDIEYTWEKWCSDETVQPMLLCESRPHHIHTKRGSQTWGLDDASVVSLIVQSDKVIGPDSWVTVLAGMIK